MAVAVLLPPTTAPVSAETGDRTLYLYHTHTHETARITFKRNGVYDPKGLQQLDWFLRDWRNNQPTQMSPQLFDLVWEVYQKVGATQPINIVSAYRSPVTNAFLHSRSAGVASHSQHMLGHAMDFFIPGIPLTRLRAVGMQQQVGGVGFYPNSGSPFVHMDVGTVRAWPRMTTAQLQAIFPDGKTLHVAANGRVLSGSGRAYAMAQWNACHAVPCTNPAALKGGAASLGHDTMVAAATTSLTGKTFSDIFQGLNPGDPKIRKPDAQIDAGDDDSQESAGPAQIAVATVPVAPVPMARPVTLAAEAHPTSRPSVSSGPITMVASAGASVEQPFPSAYGAKGTGAPLPAQRSRDNVRPQSALGAIASIEAPIPAARMAPPTVTAYAPIGPGTTAEQQLQALIQNESTGTVTIASTGNSLTNTVGTPIGAAALSSYAADRRNSPNLRNPATAALASFKPRNTQLVPPGFAEAMVQPAAMTSGTFAVFVEPNATDLNPATELGAMVARFGFRPAGAVRLGTARFAAGSLLVAAR